MRQRLFYDWIPVGMDFYLLILMSVFISFTNGIPSSISAYIVGEQAGLMDDLNMASYAYYAGMACSIPFIFRVTKFTNKKVLLIVIHLLILVFNFILSESTVTTSVMMASFLIGFTRIIGSIVLLESLMPILMPKGERYQMYCVYYPVAIVIPILSSFVAAYIAYYYQWKLSFLFQNMLILLNLLILLLFTHTRKTERNVPLYQFDWWGMLLLAGFLLFAAYFSTYGLTLNWLHSKEIIVSIVVAVLLFVVFMGRNSRVRKPVLRFSVFKFRAAVVTYVILFVFGLFYSSSVLLSRFLSVITDSNPLKSAEINTYVSLGYLLGSVLTYFYFRRTKHCQFIFVFAALCYLVSSVLIFQVINPQTDPNLLILPLVLRGVAVMVSYIAAGVYLAGNVPAKHFMSCIPFLILIRSFLVSIVWNNVLANVFYRLQVHYATHLGGLMEKINSKSIERGQQLSGAVRMQASLLSLRDMYEWLIYIGVVVVIIGLFFPFYSSEKRNIFDWTKEKSRELMQALPI